MQFYPSDWRGDSRLHGRVSLAARGLWAEMLFLMHEADPYGHLIHGDKVMTEADAFELGVAVGATSDEMKGGARAVRRALDELRDAGVYSVDSTGRIFSRRMVRDEGKRVTNSENGQKGGNPSLTSLPSNRQITESDNPVGKPSRITDRKTESVKLRIQSLDTNGFLSALDTYKAAREHRSLAWVVAEIVFDAGISAGIDEHRAIEKPREVLNDTDIAEKLIEQFGVEAIFAKLARLIEIKRARPKSILVFVSCRGLFKAWGFSELAIPASDGKTGNKFADALLREGDL
jgi:hypothetical protein